MEYDFSINNFSASSLSHSLKCIEMLENDEFKNEQQIESKFIHYGFERESLL